MLGPPLTPRERAVLGAVKRRLNNSEIAAEMFISVRTVESHISSLRRKLGADSRSGLISSATSEKERETVIGIPGNRLRGRGRDLARLLPLIDAGATVTLTGTGGVGKTRLAMECLRVQDRRVPVVVLLDQAAPEEIVGRIARAIGVDSAPGSDVIAALGVAFGAQPFLLVLDNADHVGAPTAEIIAALRARAPRLAVLSTSRTPLGHHDEIVHALEPLATDGPDAPATALLLDRIGSETLDADELAAAAAIAARLDGLPLALELAASAARHLPLSELALRLAGGFASLDRAAPEGRHRSLETAFEWTWELLEPAEKDILSRLAALPHTFDMDLAVAVTRPGAEGAVMRLLDRSLIASSLYPGRWRLLAVLREFVLLRTDDDLVREVRDTHAAYVDAIAASFVRTARTDATREAMITSHLLCPEANAALRWSVSRRLPVAPRLASSLAVGVEQYGSDVSSIEGLVLAAQDDHLLAAASPSQLAVLGNALSLFDLQRVDVLAQLALTRVADGEPRERRAAHQLAGLAAAYGPDPAAAIDHLDTAERLAIEENEVWEAAMARQFRGVALRALAARSGDPSELESALSAWESAIRAYARAGDRTHANNVRFMMALTAAETGYDPAAAARWAAECAAFAEEVANEHELAHAHLVQVTLGDAGSGDIADLLAVFRRLGDLRCVHRTLLLGAERAPDLAGRIALLRDGLAIAEAAGDIRRRARTLELLVSALYESGDDGEALRTLDALAELVGRAAAEAACPAPLSASFAAL
ncbi:MAG TPA: LuxR C-terminal-related transcriptional regulator [Microbacterium sp.]|nr:LuxR C-terminal-related transcriptional regulator [Microbacterium sp.]